MVTTVKMVMKTAISSMLVNKKIMIITLLAVYWIIHNFASKTKILFNKVIVSAIAKMTLLYSKLICKMYDNVCHQDISSCSSSNNNSNNKLICRQPRVNIQRTLRVLDSNKIIIVSTTMWLMQKNKVKQEVTVICRKRCNKRKKRVLKTFSKTNLSNSSVSSSSSSSCSKGNMIYNRLRCLDHSHLVKQIIENVSISSTWDSKTVIILPRYHFSTPLLSTLTTNKYKLNYYNKEQVGCKFHLHQLLMHLMQFHCSQSESV